MFQSPNVNALTVDKRRVLLVAEDSSLRRLVSTLLETMGWVCISVSCPEVDPILERETFDAVLLDADHSGTAAAMVLLKIQEVCLGLLTKILVIRSEVTDSRTVELIERHDLRQISHESVLRQLWPALQDLVAATHLRKLTANSMQTARTIFDSIRSPAAAHVRGSRANSQRLAYQHRNTTIDLLIELRGNSTGIAITGQVLECPRASGGIGDHPVLLVRGMKTLVRTCTNQFGEFRLECALTENACVEIRLREGEWVSLPLGKLDWAFRRASGPGASKAGPNQ